MDFTEVMRRAWGIFRLRRELWILGMLSALFGQGEFSVSTNVNQSFNTPGTADNPAGLPQFIQDNLAAWVANPLPLIIGIIGISFAIVLIFLIGGAWMQAALIHGTAMAVRDQPGAVGASLAYARSRFGAMVLLKLLFQAPALLVGIIAAVIFVPMWINLASIADNPAPETIMPMLLGSFACLLPLILLLALYGLVISLFDDLALRYCALTGSRPWQSVRQAWRLFTANLGTCVLTSVLLGIIAFLFGLIAAIPQFALMFSMFRQLATGTITPLATGSIVALVIYAIVMSVGIGGILTSFNATLWTLLFTRFQESADLPSSSSAASSLGG